MRSQNHRGARSDELNCFFRPTRQVVLLASFMGLVMSHRYTVRLVFGSVRRSRFGPDVVVAAVDRTFRQCQLYRLVLKFTCTHSSVCMCSCCDAVCMRFVYPEQVPILHARACACMCHVSPLHSWHSRPCVLKSFGYCH